MLIQILRQHPIGFRDEIDFCKISENVAHDAANGSIIALLKLIADVLIRTKNVKASG